MAQFTPSVGAWTGETGCLIKWVPNKHGEMDVLGGAAAKVKHGLIRFGRIHHRRLLL